MDSSTPRLDPILAEVQRYGAPASQHVDGPSNHHGDPDAVAELVGQGRALIEQTLPTPDATDPIESSVDAAAIATLEWRLEDLLSAAFPSAPADLDLDPGWLAIGSHGIHRPGDDDPASREARRALRLHAHVAHLIEHTWSEAVGTFVGALGDVLFTRIDVGDAVLTLAGLPRADLEAGLRNHERAVARGHLANLTLRARRELLRRFTRQVVRLARAHEPVPLSAVGSVTPLPGDLAKAA